MIGCGRIGADAGDERLGSSRLMSHAEAYATTSLVTLVALCDPDADRLERASRRWGVPAVFTDHRKLLEQAPVEIVSVCAPTSTHAGIMLDVVAAGVPGVLLEKPVAETGRDAVALARQLDGSRTVVAVNYSRRFCPTHREVAARVAGGALGRIQAVTAFYSKGIYNNGTHLADLLRMLFGDPEEAVALSAAEAFEADPTVDFRLRFQGVSVWAHGLDHEAFSIFEVDIVGARARLVLGDLGHLLAVYPVEDSLARHGFRQLRSRPDVTRTELGGATRRAIEDLVGAVTNGRRPLCTLDDGVAAMAIADQIVEGAKAIGA